MTSATRAGPAGYWVPAAVRLVHVRTPIRMSMLAMTTGKESHIAGTARRGTAPFLTNSWPMTKMMVDRHNQRATVFSRRLRAWPNAPVHNNTAAATNTPLSDRLSAPPLPKKPEIIPSMAGMRASAAATNVVLPPSGDCSLANSVLPCATLALSNWNGALLIRSQVLRQRCTADLGTTIGRNDCELWHG